MHSHWSRAAARRRAVVGILRVPIPHTARADYIAPLAGRAIPGHNVAHDGLGQNVVGLPAGGVRYQPLVIVLAAAAAGIMADRFRPLPLGAWWILAVGGLAIWIALRLARQGPRPPGVLANLVLLLAVAATAAAWHHCRWYLFPADDLGRYARCKAQPVCVEAVAVASPRAVAPSAPDPMQGRPQDDVSRLDVDLVALRNGAAWQPASGRARLTVQGPPPEIAAGDRLRVFGRLSAPSGPQNPGAFDYAARLCADGILSRLRAEVPECVSVVRPSGSWGLTRLLDQVRIQSNRLLEKHLDPRCAELAEGILLGEREQIEPDRIERFVATGAIHLLVIAGLHLGIIAGAMFWVVRRTPLSRGWANAIVAAAIVLYMLLVRHRTAGGAGHRAGAGFLRGRMARAAARCRSIRWPPHC